MVGDKACLSVVSTCTLRFCDKCPPCLGDDTQGRAFRTRQFRLEGLSETQKETSERVFQLLLLYEHLLKRFSMSKWHVLGVVRPELLPSYCGVPCSASRQPR